MKKIFNNKTKQDVKMPQS